jgi:hypothetical protein
MFSTSFSLQSRSLPNYQSIKPLRFDFVLFEDYLNTQLQKASLNNFTTSFMQKKALQRPLFRQQ